MKNVSILKQNYTKELFKELNLNKLSAKEQEEALEIMSERFNRVIVLTMLKLMNSEQKTRFAQSLENPQALENGAEEIATEIPGLAQALEAALLLEYETLKVSMRMS